MPQSVRQTAYNNPPAEGALVVLAWLVDRVKVKEVGINAGLWPTRFLASIGLGPGYAWCGALQNWTNILVGLPHPKVGAGSVKVWRDWAETNGMLISPSEAERGDLIGWVRSNGLGHIGRVTKREGQTVHTFEGNTNSSGSREGDGAYRKERHVSAFTFAVRMPK